MADGGSANERATHHYNLGVKYEREGDFDNAIREFLNSVAEDAAFPYPHKSLGELYLKGERPEEAHPHLEKALELDPDWIEARGLMADVFLELGNMNDAISNMEIAMKGDPSNIHYLSQLSRMFILEGRYTEAIELLEEAIREDPDNYKFHYNMAIAFSKRAIKDVDKSIEYWRLAMQLNPDDPKLYRNMGISFFTRGMLPEATQAFRKALAYDPDDAIAARFIQFAEKSSGK